MKDKVVLITGGTSGIGKALALQFGKNGSMIAITGRNQQTLDSTVEDLRNSGIRVLGVQADVSNEEDNRRTVEQVVKEFGTLHILINNAGISMRALFEDVELDVIRKVMDINFYGAVYTTKFSLPYIIENKGSVIGISSIAGFRGLPARVGYSASKFALQGFLEVLRTEMLHKGVHVLTALPGFTSSNIRKTALSEDGSQQGESPRDESKMMSAEDCAKHIYRATLKRKKFLILTREGKMAVLMNKLFPGYMDKIMYKYLAKEPDSPLKG